MTRRISMLLISAVLAASAAYASSNSASNGPRMLVQSNWLAAHLSDRNLVILHVGADPATYNAGHVPGARFLALSDIVTTRDGIPNQLPALQNLKAAFERLGVGDRSRVVIYSDMLGLFAARAYFTLDYLGHGDSTFLLDGGLEAWSKEHVTVRTLPVTPSSATLTGRPRPDLLIDLPAVREVVSNKSTLLIDARSPTDYAGMGRSEGVTRPGHIPGAINVFWVDNLVSQQNPTLKPLPEIRARYISAGIKPGAKAIVYCRSSMQASHDYFTLKLAGFRPRLYAGSYIEWNSAFATAVETGTGPVH